MTRSQPFALRHRLIFIRHGETDWNAEARLQGQRDVPLNPRGRDQARGVGRLLRAWSRTPEGDGVATLPYASSPLLRTRETMGFARDALGLDPDRYALDPGLIELTFGQWEGFTWSEIKLRDLAGYRARRADKWNFVPPGGESYAMLAERVAAWAERLDDERVVVSHGGVARVLMHLVAGVPEATAAEAPVHQGRVLIFESGRFRWLKADGVADLTGAVATP